MVEHQGPRRYAVCKILVHGMQDVTDRLNPYLISVQVIDSVEGGHSEAHIELDDRNCELMIPPDNVPLTVMMGWSGEGPRPIDFGRKSPAGGQGPMGTMGVIESDRTPLGRAFAEQQAAAQGTVINQEAAFGGPGLEVVFAGWVSEVESGFGRRGGGRRLWITGTGGNTKSLVKEAQSKTVGEGKEDDSAKSGEGKHKLQELMGPVMEKAGLTLKMSPAMKKVARDHWATLNESPQMLGQRMADELGGVFSINNGIATLVGRGEGVNADGVAMLGIEAVWGVNLIGWRIKPFTGRTQWGASQSRFFDLHAGEWDKIKAKIGGSNPFGGAQAIAHTLGAVTGQNEGKQSNEGSGQASTAKRGTGWVLLNGEPRAHAHCNVTIIDARPGVDGTYYVSEAEHNYTRGVGYTTRCNVQYYSPRKGDYNWPTMPEEEKQKQVEEQADKAQEEADKLKADADKAKADADEKFIQDRANSDFVPGRAPFDNYGGWFSGPPSALDKLAAQRWYTQRDKPIPDEWK